MGDKDPAPGAKGTAEPGTAATNPAATDIAKTLADLQKSFTDTTAAQNAQIEALKAEAATAAENHRQQIARLKKKPEGGDPQGQPTGLSEEAKAEIESLKERLAKSEKDQADARAREKSASISGKLSAAIAALPGLIPDATGIIADAVRANLDMNSSGEVVYKDGAKHIPLAEKLAEFAAKPFFQAAANRGGGGKPGEGLPNAGNNGQRTVRKSDTEGRKKFFNEIANGTVTVVDD